MVAVSQKQTSCFLRIAICHPCWELAEKGCSHFDESEHETLPFNGREQMCIRSSVSISIFDRLYFCSRFSSVSDILSRQQTLHTGDDREGWDAGALRLPSVFICSFVSVCSRIKVDLK